QNLVPPADFSGIIDTWADSIKTQIRTSAKISASPKKKVAKAKTTRRKSSAVGKRRKATPKAAAVTKSTKAKKPKEAEKPQPIAAPSKSSLPLPENYRSIVSHLYGPSLKRIMPEGKTKQRSFLKALAQESPDGATLLTEQSAIIADKYTGKMSPEAAYSGLKKKAQELLEELSGAPKGKAAGSGKKKASPGRGRRKKKEK
ncbi:MAG: hypothetical protein AAGB01_06680, partial [Cyanobacteria bacterium P01_F01_bin.42]